MAEKDRTMSKSPTNMEPDSPPPTSQGVSKVVEKGTSSLERTLTEDGPSAGRGSGSRGRAGNMAVGCLTKRGRGRPRGSGKMQGSTISLGGFPAETAGADLIPHVVTVHTGEDVVGKIFSFAEGDSRAICILSASGVVSTVELCKPCTPGATITHEGRFQILTLSGWLTLVEMRDGARVRNGILSVSLANPDGSVFGGSVAGPLTADSPIQLVLGSFKQTGMKELVVRSSAGPSTTTSVPHNSAQFADPISMARPVSDNELSLLPNEERQISCLSGTDPES